jgi:hypothetical protein
MRARNLIKPSESQGRHMLVNSENVQSRTPVHSNLRMTARLLPAACWSQNSGHIPPQTRVRQEDKERIMIAQAQPLGLNELSDMDMHFKRSSLLSYHCDVTCM